MLHRIPYHLQYQLHCEIPGITEYPITWREGFRLLGNIHSGEASLYFLLENIVWEKR